MVALKTPGAPRPSCDRYGHPVCAGVESARFDQLRRYLETHETEIAGRWRGLVRKLCRDGVHPVEECRLVEAVTAALRELERDPGPGGGDWQGAPGTRDLLREVCLSGLECPDRLVPLTARVDQRSLQEIREQLRRRLFCLVKGLAG